MYTSELWTELWGIAGDENVQRCLSVQGFLYEHIVDSFAIFMMLTWYLTCACRSTLLHQWSYFRSVPLDAVPSHNRCSPKVHRSICSSFTLHISAAFATTFIICHWPFGSDSYSQQRRYDACKVRNKRHYTTQILKGLERWS